MTIEIHDDELRDDSPETTGAGGSAKKKRTPPPDYFSRAIRMRLMALTALLMLVVFLMFESGKPENWTWMGFDRQAPLPQTLDTQTEDGEDNVRFAAPQTTEPQTTETPTNAQDNSEQDSQSPQSVPAASSADADENIGEPASRPSRFVFNGNQIAADVQPLTEKAAHEFWLSEFNEMSETQCRELFLLMRHARNRQPINAQDVQPLTQVVERLVQDREKYHLRLLDNVSILSDTAVQKPELSKQYFDSKKLWDEQILPVLQNTLTGEDITIEQLQSIHALQLTLDGFALNRVDDRTSLNQPDEGLAWLRCWELAVNPGSAEFQSVRHIELNGQASTFRGKRVSIEGRIRSARQIKVRENELGFDTYYVIWLLPADTNVSPYCVYTLDLPEGFPHVTGKTLELDEPVRVAGVFFKIRTYVAADESVQHCPLLLSQSFDWIQEASIPAASDSGWWPGWKMALTALILMPLMACYVAWRAYTVTRSFRRRPGTASRNKINNGLTELQKNPEIKTDIENIMSLYENDQVNES